MTNLDDLLNFDALQVAEQITGQSYKADSDTTGLGMLLHMMNGQARSEAVTKLDDTPFSCPLDTYLRIVQEEGFKIVFTRTGKKANHNQIETHYIMWHDDGMLLSFDTYNGKRNGADIYFNWKGSDRILPEKCSGGLECPVGLNRLAVPDSMMFAVGKFDAREAVRHNISKMRRDGKLLKPWRNVGISFFLTAHWDWQDGFDPDAHNAKIIAQLPKHVVDAISPKPFDINTLPRRLRAKFIKNKMRKPYRLWNKTYTKPYRP